MFPYDSQLLTIVQTPPQTIDELIDGLKKIDNICEDGDGAKWFNLLYLRVTVEVKRCLDEGRFNDPAWLELLDVQFGRFYYLAMSAVLQGNRCPGCWRVPLSVRDDTRIARIQFALAGMNAHINYDLPQAIVATARISNLPPSEGTAQHQDFLFINPLLADLIDEAKADLSVRLLGDPLPTLSHVGDTIAAWGITAARSKAWKHAETLWAIRKLPLLTAGFVDGLDGLTTFGSKTLLVPVR